MAEYEVKKINDIGTSYQFEVEWIVKINGSEKKGRGDWAFGKESCYKIIGYDNKNNPIPRWKFIIERALREMEQMGNAPEELKPIVGKKIKL